MTAVDERYRSRALPYVAPFVWSAYVLWRAPEWGLLRGIPLTPVSVAVLFAVWWIWSIRRTLPGVKWLLLLLLLKMACHPVLVPRGLHASYFSNASRQGLPERGLYGAWPSETRVDAKVAFGNGWPDLPLYYLNDQRFNHPRATQERSSMEWRGLLLVSEEGADLELYLAGRGVAAETLIDGFRVVALESTQDQAIGHVRARSGLRQLTVRAASPSGIPKTFQAGISDPSSGSQRPFGRADVLLTRASRTRLQADRILRLLSVMCDIGVLVMLVIAGAIGLRETIKAAPRLGWQTTVVRTLPLLACAEALWFAQRTWGRVEFLAWGSDRLMYESYARDIMFHGALMTVGAPLGQGTPYFYQPLYPYFLSAAHLVTGEGMWGAYLLQRLGLALAFYAIWMTARTLFDETTATMAMVLAIWFVYVRLNGLSRALYNESLFVPLICLWMLWLCRETVKPGTQHLLIGAALGALAALARSTMLATLPPVAMVLGMAYRRYGQPMGRLALLLVLLASMIGLATVRNWIVAGQFVPVTNSFALNLHLGNRPSSLILPDDDHHWWMDWIASNSSSRAVLEYAYHAPGPFAKGLLVKAAYVLGLESMFGVTRPRAYVSTIAIHRTLPWIWLAALLGGLLLMRRGAESRTGRLAQLIPALLALSQFAVIVAVFPYSERLVLPIYALILVYAAVPIGALFQRIPRE